MAMAQSLGQKLDKTYDFFALLTPNVDNLLKNGYKPSTILHRFPPVIAELALLGVGTPNQLARILKSVERGDLRIRTNVTGVERHLEHLERLVNRGIIGILLTAVILGLALVFLAYRLSSSSWVQSFADVNKIMIQGKVTDIL